MDEEARGIGMGWGAIEVVPNCLILGVLGMRGLLATCQLYILYKTRTQIRIKLIVKPKYYLCPVV